jgi:hypothetical protein
MFTKYKKRKEEKKNEKDMSYIESRNIMANVNSTASIIAFNENGFQKLPKKQ